MVWQIISGLIGLAGLALGIWNRIEQGRETRRRAQDALPYFTAILDNPRADGWRTLRLAIVNPGNANFVMTRVRVISPSDCWIAPKVEVEGDDPALRSMDVEWRVYAKDQPSGHNVASGTHFRCRADPGSRPKLMVSGYLVKSGRPHFEEPIHVSFPGEKTEVAVPRL